MQLFHQHVTHGARLAPITVAATEQAGIGIRSPVAESAPFAQAGSYYLTHLRATPLVVAGMMPTILTPLEEEKPVVCPEACNVLSSETTYASRIAPYLRALGTLRFGRRAVLPSVVNDASAAVADAWDRALDRSEGVPGEYDVLRVLVKHYPRPDAPGRCITIQTDVYTVPDRYLDWGGAINATDVGARLPGYVVRLRRTVQTEGDALRLVEASIEVLERLHVGGPQVVYGELLGEPSLRNDEQRNAHFEDFGATRRRGLLWLDRSYGRGTPRPWSRAYAIRIRHEEEPAEAQAAALPADWVEALRGLVERL